MLVNVEKTETYTTSFKGKLSGDQFRKLITEALLHEIVALPRYSSGVSVEVTIGEKLMPSASEAWPEVSFEVTQDHNFRTTPDLAPGQFAYLKAA